MTDAPERPDWLLSDGNTIEFVEGGVRINGTLYAVVRADLYAALEQERDIFQGTVKGLVALREWCPENAFATHGNDAEWVCDCYACNERRDALCGVERLRAAIRDEAQRLDIEAEQMDEPDSGIIRKRAARLRALTKPEGEK